MSEDAVLLRQYAEKKSDDAFAELVRRHLNLVYSVALRQVNGDVHLAEDVAQQVFAALARKAASLVESPSLSGWLYRSTHFVASDMVRKERRRRSREQEALSMHRTENAEAAAGGSPENQVDWDKVRPSIDAAIAELDARDRDAVSLRFFDGRSFAEVGTRLQLSENAARMRVERALDKLHATLSRRGVTSTTAALALALANQVSVGAPTGLAASIAGTAIVGAATGATGILGFMTSAKLLAGLGAGVSAAAIGVAVIQYQEKTDTESALRLEEQRRRAVQSELTNVTQRLAETERRASEADKDSLELLRAVQPFRDPRTAVPKRDVRTAVVEVGDDEDAERRELTREYQQQLAKRRAQEANALVRIDEAERTQDALTSYERLIDAAEHNATHGEYQSAVRLFNRAMQMKPAGLELSERVRQLQALLKAQNPPVDVTLLSDGATWVSIASLRAPEKFQTAAIKMLPGNYEIVGRRKGYRDVRMTLQVRNGVAVPPLSIVCTVVAENQP